MLLQGCKSSESRAARVDIPSMRLTGAHLLTLALASAFTASIGASGAPQASQSSAPRPVADASSQRQLLNRYCVTCHNARAKVGGLVLENMDLADVGAHGEVWEKVVRKLRAGMMPPPGMPAPAADDKHALVQTLEASLDRAAAATARPGRPLVHRLNRAEYANAIRDLLALDIDPAPLLPADDSSAGFDNIADVLGLSPVLIESYLSAAGQISALAIGDPKTPPMGEVYRVRQDASQSRHVEGLPLGTVGGFVISRNIPLDGEYVFQVKLFRTNLGTMRGLEFPHELEISVDGQRVHLASFGGDRDVRASSDNPTTTGDEVDNRFTVRVPLKAGPRKIAVAFIEKTHGYNSRRLQSFIRSSADTIDFSGQPHIDQFLMTGPFNATAPSETPSRHAIFTCRPTNAADEPGCARKILTRLARRAYRGDLNDADTRVLLDFFSTGRERTGTFDGGIDMALRRMLASPKFLVRVEADPAGIAPGAVYPVSGLALASRLSFFLWSSIPDDELLDVAAKGELTHAAVLDAQVRRMLADPKANALAENFAGQWLYLRNLRNKQPNSFQFPDFDDDLRRAMIAEVQLFFKSVVDEDRDVLDLLSADYSFVNERLARHYGIPGIYGSQMRRVTLADEARRGLLGKGAILLATSHAHRTSPVLRGKWVLENIIGVSPAPPPDNVPTLNDEQKPEKPRSGREALEQHRANPTCAACHRVLDPIGFALENFDAVGAWRDKDGGTLGDTIDASGQLVDGTKINGVVDLRHALEREPETFVRTLTEKLLTYAVGRGLTSSDMPVVRSVVRNSAAEHYRFSSIVLGIVHSVPFQMRTAADPARDALEVASAAQAGAATAANDRTTAKGPASVQ
jgi:mono/diheme cytochrome c family protein